LALYLGGSAFVVDGRSVEATLRFGRRTADGARAAIPYPYHQAQILSDGSVLCRVVANSLDELAGWVVQHGSGAKVVQPEALRQKVVSLARQALDNHAGRAARRAGWGRTSHLS
jgi:predicted DNA-binding transcriptional regulator YafY